MTAQQIPQTLNSQAQAKARRKALARKFYWGKIDSLELAEFIPREAAKGLYLLALFQAIIGLIFIGPLEVILPALYALIAFLMAKFISRVAAIILLIFSLLVLVSVVMVNIASGSGGVNLIIVILMLWFSIRAAQATFKYHRLKRR